MIFLALIPLVLALVSPAAALGLVAASLPTYQVRFTIAGIPTTLLELSVYAATLGLLVRCLRRRILITTLHDVWIAARPLRWPLLALLATAMLSAMLSVDIQRGLGAVKGWFFDAAVFAALLIVTRKSTVNWFVGGLAVGTVAISLYGLWEYVFVHARLVDGRLNSVFETPNYHAMLVVPVLALLAGMALTRHRWRWAWVVVGIDLLSLLLTFSYGGFMGVAAGALILVLLTLPKRRRWFAVGVIVLASITLIVGLVRTDKFRRLGDFTGRSSSHVRVEIWRVTWYLIQRHPVVGVGPGNFEPAYREAVPRVVFPPLEWLVAQPHNLFLALMSQLGLVGTLAFLWLLIQYFRVAARHASLRAPLVAAMVALLVHGLVDTPFFKNDSGLLVLGLIGLTLVSDHAEAGRDVDPSR